MKMAFLAEQSRFSANPIKMCTSFIFIALVKHHDQSNIWTRDFILFHVSRVLQSLIVTGIWEQEQIAER